MTDPNRPTTWDAFGCLCLFAASAILAVFMIIGMVTVAGWIFR